MNGRLGESETLKKKQNKTKQKKKQNGEMRAWEGGFNYPVAVCRED